MRIPLYLWRRRLGVIFLRESSFRKSQQALIRLVTGQQFLFPAQRPSHHPVRREFKSGVTGDAEECLNLVWVDAAGQLSHMPKVLAENEISPVNNAANNNNNNNVRARRLERFCSGPVNGS